MGTNTYANSNEICSKSSSGKTMGAMPDPCFTPPPTPAGVEVVVPYPNTAMASDLDKGSAKVLICNKMAALEKDSYMKTSMGDEAAKPSTMQGGVVTKTTKGKAYFTNWSPDVKFEGKGVCRHIDPTTHNHGSTPGHCVPMPFMSGMNPGGACSNAIKNIEDGCKTAATEESGGGTTVAKKFNVDRDIVCKGMENLPSSFFDNKAREAMKKNGESIDTGQMLASEMSSFKKIADQLNLEGISKVKSSNEAMIMITASMVNTVKTTRVVEGMNHAVNQSECLKAMRCALQKYSTTQNKKAVKKIACCKGQSGHHVVPSAMGDIHCLKTRGKAPVICVEGCNNSHGTHGMIHRNLARILKGQPEMWCYKILSAAGRCVNATFSDCSKSCIKAQLRAGEKQCPCGNEKVLNTHPGLNAEVVGPVEKAY